MSTEEITNKSIYKRISKRSITEDAKVSSRSSQMRIWRNDHSTGYLKSQDFLLEIADG